MKRINNYKGYVIDTDNLGRQYAYFKASPFTEEADKKIIGCDLKVKEIKATIDEATKLGYWS